jgi:hypothetical protein
LESRLETLDREVKESEKGGKDGDEEDENYAYYLK